MNRKEDVIVWLAGAGILICERYQFCDKGRKYDGFARDMCNSIVPNKCGGWCYQKKICRHLHIVPTKETKISSVD